MLLAATVLFLTIYGSLEGFSACFHWGGGAVRVADEVLLQQHVCPSEFAKHSTTPPVDHEGFKPNSFGVTYDRSV